MSGFIIVAAVVVLGLIMTGSFSSKNAGSRIQKQISVLQNAKRNADVKELLDLIVRVSHMSLQAEQQTKIADIVDKFIQGNDITAAKATKALIEKSLNMNTPTATETAPAYSKSSVSRLAVLIKRMDAVKDTSSDMGEICSLLRQVDQNKLDAKSIEELSAIIITTLNIINTEKNPRTIANNATKQLNKIKLIFIKNNIEITKNEESLLTKKVKPDNTINNIVPKTVKEEKPADVLKAINATATAPIVTSVATVKDTAPSVVATAQATTTIKPAGFAAAPVTKLEGYAAPVIAASLQDTIAAIESAKIGLADKKLIEHVNSIVLLLGQTVGQNGLAAARYSRYLLSMMRELASKPPYAQSGATVLVDNMLSVYQALAAGTAVDIEKAEKAIRTDMYMRSFAVEDIK